MQMWPDGCVLCYVLGTPQAAWVLCLCWKHPINHWLQSSVILVQSLNAVSSSLPRVTETTLLPAVTHQMWPPDPLACSNRASWDQGKRWLALRVQGRVHNVLTHSPLYNRMTLGPPVFRNVPTHPVRLSASWLGSGYAWGQRDEVCL